MVANTARQQLQRIADRADVNKPVNPHAFRYTAFTVCLLGHKHTFSKQTPHLIDFVRY